MRAQHVAVSILLFLALTQRLGAQSIPLLQRGTRVRAVYRSDSGMAELAVAGNLVRLSGDTAVIARGPRLRHTFIPTPSNRLEVRTSICRGHAVRGAAAGFVAGSLGGAIIGSSYEPSPDFFNFKTANTVGGLLIGGLAGAALGSQIGSLIRHEEWTPVSTTGVRVGLLVNPRRVGLSVQSAF